jgi:hypothetical protein
MYDVRGNYLLILNILNVLKILNILKLLHSICELDISNLLLLLFVIGMSLLLRYQIDALTITFNSSYSYTYTYSYSYSNSHFYSDFYFYFYSHAYNTMHTYVRTDRRSVLAAGSFGALVTLMFSFLFLVETPRFISNVMGEHQRAVEDLAKQVGNFQLFCFMFCLLVYSFTVFLFMIIFLIFDMNLFELFYYLILFRSVLIYPSHFTYMCLRQFVNSVNFILSNHLQNYEF